MLQLPERKNTRVAPRSRRSADHPMKSALSVIKASIQPIGDDPNLLDELCYMSERNDVAGMIALYDAYSSAANGLLLIQNQPRAAGRANDFLEEECCQLWAKAYLVADFLKETRPDRHNVGAFAGVLFDCALRMGNNLTAAAAIVAEIAEINGGPR
jgi:hypothetical protein